MWFVFHACIVLGERRSIARLHFSWEDDAILHAKSGCGYEGGDIK